MVSIKFPNLERVRSGLRCACGYSLSGHAEAVITCPECGRRGTLPDLILASWGDRWNRAPWFRQLRRSASLFVVGLLSMCLCWLSARGDFGLAVAISAMLALAALAGWLFDIWQMRAELADGRIARAVILLHLVYGSYVLALLVAVAAGLLAIVSLALRDALFGTFTGATTVVAVGVMKLCRFSEKRIARAIAGRLMRRWTGVATMRA